MRLSDNHIRLRALEPDDLTFLYNVENSTENWKISRTQLPFSRYLLQQYLEQSGASIYEAKQFRFVIVDCNTEAAIGLIDFFEFDPQNRSVGCGIIIQDQAQRQLGYGTRALKLAIDYAFKVWDVHQIWAQILSDNTRSIGLFEKMGFERGGCKKDWLYFEGQFHDEFFYQLIRKK